MSARKVFLMSSFSDSVESTSGQAVPGPSIHVSFSLLQENGFQEQVGVFYDEFSFMFVISDLRINYKKTYLSYLTAS